MRFYRSPPSNRPPPSGGCDTFNVRTCVTNKESLAANFGKSEMLTCEKVTASLSKDLINRRILFFFPLIVTEGAWPNSDTGRLTRF